MPSSRASIRRHIAHGALAVVVPAVAGCSLGGGATSSPVTVAASPAAGASGAGGAQAAVAVHLPGAYVAPSASRRRPDFVSPSSGGLAIQIYAPGNEAGTPVSTVLADVSGGNATPTVSKCTADAADPGRTCTVSITAPVGTYDFVVTTYASPPSGGSFAGASKLGSGTVPRQQLVAGTVATISVTLNGIVSALQLTAPPSYDAYAPLSASVGVVALDASNNVIIGTYDAPVTVAAAANPAGSTSPTLSLDGGAATAGSVAVTQSSDTVALAIPAQTAASAGNAVTISARDGSGAVTASKPVSPLYVTAATTGATFAATAPPSVTYTATNGSANVTLSEGTFAGTYTVALDAAAPAACSANPQPFVLSDQMLTASASKPATFTLATTGTAAPAGGCAYDVSDGTTTVALTAISGFGTGTVTTTVPSSLLYLTVLTSPAGGPANAAADPVPADFGNAIQQPQIDVVRVSDGTLYTISDSNLREPLGIAHDAAGDVFIADGQMHEVHEYPPSSLVGVGSAAAATNASPLALYTGFTTPDGLAVVQSTGRLYVSDYSAGTVTAIDTTQAAQTVVSTMNVGGNPAGVAVDAAGDVFVAFPRTAAVSEYAPPASGTTTPAAIATVGTKGLFVLPVAIQILANGTIDVLDAQAPASQGAEVAGPAIYSFAPTNLATSTQTAVPSTEANDGSQYGAAEAAFAVSSAGAIDASGYNPSAKLVEYVNFASASVSAISNAPIATSNQVYVPYMSF